ncbi:hypothetical protein [Nocardia sp. NBC_01388]|uniref:hypothetical protein n=1 Tax=Nocardia sp. NBC_01388 TaxID=2903596 RepID=UPI003243B4B5
MNAINPMAQDVAQMQSCADNTAASLGELEGYLQKMNGVQEGLHGAVQNSVAGMAISNALGNTWQSGKSLGATLQDVITTLKSAGVQVHSEDLTGQSRINAALGNDGVLNAGAAPKVDLQSW